MKNGDPGNVIKVAIADDHILFRAGVKTALSSKKDVKRGKKRKQRERRKARSEMQGVLLQRKGEKRAERSIRKNLSARERWFSKGGFLWNFDRNMCF